MTVDGGEVARGVGAESGRPGLPVDERELAKGLRGRGGDTAAGQGGGQRAAKSGEEGLIRGRGKGERLAAAARQDIGVAEGERAPGWLISPVLSF